MINDSSLKIEFVMRFLALGDSYTIGERVTAVDRWPNQLVNRLRSEGVKMADPLIIAQTGWTTAELNAGIDAADPKEPFDSVSLLIGVNNQYRGLSQEAYRVEFRALLARAIGFARDDPGKVVVLSIPDWGVTPFARANGRDPHSVAVEIDAFNDINREEAERKRVQWVDVTTVSRQAVHDPILIADDGLHPSAKMYEKWVEQALPVFRNLINA